ncbi:MAG: S9 family peptidase [Chloroflexi bacterium]|nr:S9 family peptidase [Chloroflexota bacterium]
MRCQPPSSANAGKPIFDEAIHGAQWAVDGRVEEYAVERDIRNTPLYREIEEHFLKVYRPAFGTISAPSQPAPSPDGRLVAFTGTRLDKLDAAPITRVCTVDVATGTVEELTGGPNDDRAPAWSPDGSRLAFLSDRREKGQFDLYLLEAGRMGEAVAAPAAEGTVEYVHWSPDGSRILLGVAARGADLAGVQGSGTTDRKSEELPSWVPSVDTGAGEDQWRRLYLYDVAARTLRPLSRPGLIVWEASWAGPDRVLAIVSDNPSEDAWYSASLASIDVASGQDQILYRSDVQLGLPAASPSGRRLAVVQALCSDRAVVAGDVLLIDPEGGEVEQMDSCGVDVTHLVWRDEDRLLFAGLCGLHSCAGEYNARSGETRLIWESDGNTGGYNPAAWPAGEDGLVTTLESYGRYPEVVLVEDGQARPITHLAHAGAEDAASLGGRLEEVTWTAPDGLEIQGFLLRPDGPGPYPLIVNVHGGPVSTVRNRWMGASLPALLVARGYAMLFPNPRGSSGRGQGFARLVYGDVGGAETRDHLSGVDALVERGIADPARLGVTGGSHGGFMTSWIITQTDRFAAAVAIAPVTDWFSQHGTSNIGRFDRLFLQDDPWNPAGLYFQRSPVLQARRARTPTLVIAGGKDRCTPSGQAIEFHRALREQDVESTLVIYPEEGHGVRNLPALIDMCTRAVDWFERHMPAKQAGESLEPAEAQARV